MVPCALSERAERNESMSSGAAFGASQAIMMGFLWFRVLARRLLYQQR